MKTHRNPQQPLQMTIPKTRLTRKTTCSEVDQPLAKTSRVGEDPNAGARLAAPMLCGATVAIGAALGNKKQKTEDTARNSVSDSPRGEVRPQCTALLHHCQVKPGTGCPSCHRTCHADCTDVRCVFSPCEVCLSLSLVTHADSKECQDLQNNPGDVTHVVE